ncbi:TIGR03619 family F420-dependent LLM class oxidoreductase [Nocardioides dongkuii]|uniref:TIGR03619 family F420-dependent LLM class oxidoreductase n=1 Tax=Nocardioides dongkuii TaxID=2760089 RepID=UPI0015FC2333|nr:TIGR03619 family F420-dependent LLM class oxidoreductase [Nocardioides dongkuii]
MTTVSLQMFGLPLADYLPVAQLADSLGFETLWLSDHVVTPADYAKLYPYSGDGDPGYRQDTPLADVAVTLAHLAAGTTRIKLGVGVMVLPLRNVFHVARSWATLQELSGGRAVLGVGAGWMREEFDVLGLDFAVRGELLDEQLEVLDLLWSGRPASYAGRHHRFAEVYPSGSPSSPIPVVVGGHGPAALRRAARSSGWLGPAVPLEESVRLVSRLTELRTAAGLGDRPFRSYVRLVGEVSPATVRRYADAGFEDLVASPFGGAGRDLPLPERLRALEELAAEVEITPPPSRDPT